jgi:formamidopyrimidine-DNA glycosylase
MNGKKIMKYLLIHFGMTGSLVWKGKNIPTYQSFSISKDVWPPKFCKLEIVFTNGNRVADCDPRRLGRIKLRANPLNEEPLNKLAPDPSIDGIGNRDDVLKKMNNINTSIKSTLLDQERLYCGLGNWLADEVLYQSCIHPETITKKITGKAFHRLLDTIQSVISIAITCCIEEKSFPQDWLFHYRWDRKISKMPSGEMIKTLKIGGRTSVYIPSIQKICTESNNNYDEKDEISNSNSKKRKGNEKDIEEKKSKKKKVDK